MKVIKESIRTIGLRSYLDGRRDEQNGLGYDTYALLIEIGKASNSLIRRLYRINARTAIKWRLIYKEEKQSGKK